MTPKPLTSEVRKAAELAAVRSNIIEALLAAEAFWRESAKNLSPFNREDYCYFCGFREHRPDCPWKLAQ